MIVECHACESKVDAEILGQAEEFHDKAGEPYCFTLTKCPVCASTLLAGQDLLQTGQTSYDWGDATRLWPDPDDYLHSSYPDEVRRSLEEARKCYKAKSNSACAVMCGRAIEAICVEHTKERTLAKGSKALRAGGIIDGRLFEWGDSLRHERNLGAHATGVSTTREAA